MNKHLTWALILLAALLLCGCGAKPFFGVSSEADNSILVTAERGPDGSMGLGYLEVAEGEEVVIDADLQSGRIRLRWMQGLLGSADFPDEPTAESTVTDGVMRFSIEPGSYTVGVIAEGKVSGTARIYTEAAATVVPGAQAEDMLGVWTEKFAGRGNVEIREGAQADSYEVLVTWGGADEASVWTMTARPEDGGLRYEDARHSSLHFDADGGEAREELIYENGSGFFYLNSAWELMWEDDVEDAGLNLLFISQG